MPAFCFVFISLFAYALCNPLTRPAMVVHETQELPAGFSRQGPAPADTMLNMRIALTSTDVDGLIRALMDVSTPSNPSYGQHLTKEQAEAFVAPKPEAVQAVNSWFAMNNISTRTVSPAGDWMSFSVPVSKADELLDTQFFVFRHDKTGMQTIRTLDYSIPANLVGLVDLIYPTINFPDPFGHLPVMMTPVTKVFSGAQIAGIVPDSCRTSITPACLQAIYGIPTSNATQKANQLAVSGYFEQWADDADLQTFLTKFRPELSGAKFAVQTIDGGSNPQGQDYASIEANLDIQYTVGIASGVPVTFISVGEESQDDLDGFLDIVNFLQFKTDPPQVLTISYGFNEDELSSALANKLCNAYAQLGARGTSILFASGDGGVSGSGAPRLCLKFVPTFPSGCPFMTSVGATAGLPETAAYFSSGGFSNLFRTPDYQVAAVTEYLAKLGPMYAQKFNPSGRAYPDVAVLGENVEIVYYQQTSTVDGPSCSIFASIISLINDRLIAAGRRPLGFLNPFLYGPAASTFTDITSGSNPGCGTEGFPAKVGWDPVTGLGSPNFEKLAAAAGVPSRSVS